MVATTSDRPILCENCGYWENGFCEYWGDSDPKGCYRKDRDE